MDTMSKGASTVEAKLYIIMAPLVEALEENRKYKEEIKQLTIKVNTLEKDNNVGITIVWPTVLRVVNNRACL
jgi:hypothetical protein